MEHTLLVIAKHFNANNILWGIGGSLMLKHYGIVDSCNDIDLIVAEQDYEKANEILDILGDKKPTPSKDNYRTKYFSSYNISGVDVDIMSKFIICHEEGSYEYIFDSSSITMIEKIDDISLPYTGLEDWYILYMLMDRERKAVLIENYLHGKVVDKMLVDRALKQPLPAGIKVRASAMVRN